MAEPIPQHSDTQETSGEKPAVNPVAPLSPEELARQEKAAAEAAKASEAGAAEAQQSSGQAEQAIDAALADGAETNNDAKVDEADTAVTDVAPSASQRNVMEDVKSAVSGFREFASGLVDSFRGVFQNAAVPLLQNAVQEMRGEGLGMMTKLGLRLSLALGGPIPNASLESLSDDDRKLLSTLGIRFKPEQKDGQATGRTIISFEGKEDDAVREQIVFEQALQDSFRGLDSEHGDAFANYFITELQAHSNMGALKEALNKTEAEQKPMADLVLKFLTEHPATDDVAATEYFSTNREAFLSALKTGAITAPAPAPAPAPATPPTPNQ